MGEGSLDESKFLERIQKGDCDYLKDLERILSSLDPSERAELSIILEALASSNWKNYKLNRRYARSSEHKDVLCGECNNDIGTEDVNKKD